ncbi:MAG: ribosome-associated translation inhibitor RaiA [Alphaproteobacteria bacterium]
MQLSVKGKQIDVGDSLRQHVEQNLKDIIGKHFSTPLDAQVTFSREAHLFRADIHVHAGRGITLQSHGAATEVYAAFDEASARIGERLRRHHNRLKDYHKKDVDAHATVMAQSFVLQADGKEVADEAPDNPVVVAEMTTPIETLTVGEAVMRLDLGDLPALLFRNRAHGNLNMIYRRADGHIGWVDPTQNIAVNQPAAAKAVSR